jgi:hypothetical protein
MKKKNHPILLVAACFIAVAFLTMIYGFTHAAPFSEKALKKKQPTVSYTLPNIVPSVWAAGQ